ncbi:MAG TPA: thermonuclease family protein [Alphaproteobacteria bacterium]|nr:thermonuclease family protein [Alphaproteobacteria bacterium]
MPSFLNYLVTFFCLILAQPIAIGQEVISGQASIIDGDTIRIDNIKIRLLGIDAPDKGKDPQSVFYTDSKNALSVFIGQHKISCQPTGDKSYDRIVAKCFMGKTDLAAYMVLNGWAVDWPKFSKGDYADEMLKAQQQKLGVWQKINYSWR